jgi:hypothetical protein
MSKSHVIPAERIASRIDLIRGEKVMLDRDLAELYGVGTRALLQAVKRNAEKISGRFRVSAHRRGIRKLEITDCDLKFLGWSAVRAI